MELEEFAKKAKHLIKNEDTKFFLYVTSFENKNKILERGIDPTVEVVEFLSSYDLEYLLENPNDFARDIVRDDCLFVVENDKDNERNLIKNFCGDLSDKENKMYYLYFNKLLNDSIICKEKILGTISGNRNGYEFEPNENPNIDFENIEVDTLVLKK